MNTKTAAGRLEYPAFFTMIAYSEKLKEAASKGLSALKKKLKIYNHVIKDCTKQQAPHTLRVMYENGIRANATLEYYVFGDYKVAEVMDANRGWIAVIAKAE